MARNGKGGLRWSGLAAGAALLVCVPAVAKEAGPIVAVTGGKLRGVPDGDIVSWKGIPFAAPPIGALRWRAPQPVKPWKSILDAAAYRNDCMQKPFPSDAAPLGTPPAEDCLYANVWRPKAGGNKLPVAVWIYGGGFVNGGSSPPTYTGAELARRGLVFVSFNYRVGRFGTFAHPALTREDADKGLLANYGYMDQLAALRWVQRNARAFGGDPGNVTIIGESAGGMSVINWLTSPLGKGLFHKAVVMSGGNGDFLGGESGLREQEAIGSAFAQSKGIAADDPQALVRLRALHADEVTDGLSMDALGKPGPRTYSSPFADGKLALRPITAFTAGRFAHVPVMIGATSMDIGGRKGPMITGARDLAGLLSGQGVPVYHYRFSYVAPAQGSPKSGAWHATDIPFFLDTVAIKYGKRTVPADRAMGNMIATYLANFIAAGDPNGKGGALPRWAPFDPKTREVMDFTQQGTAVQARDPWAP